MILTLAELLKDILQIGERDPWFHIKDDWSINIYINCRDENIYKLKFPFVTKGKS